MNELNTNIREAVERFYFHRMGTLTSFTDSLYRLIARADLNNRASIKRGFPLEVQIFEEWELAPSEAEFFKRYDLYFRG